LWFSSNWRLESGVLERSFFLGLYFRYAEEFRRTGEADVVGEQTVDVLAIDRGGEDWRVR
jgi:hypothetical protein